MKRILIVYGTVEGQTRKIASFIANDLQSRGCHVDVFDSENMPKVNLTAYDGIIAGAPVHISKFPRHFRKWIKQNAADISLVPCAFFSVCLGILQKDNPKVQNEENKIVKNFLREVAWSPDHWCIFPGALVYSQYGWIKRQIMKAISKQAGRDTDVNRDYEYTDWLEVKKFSSDFLNNYVLRASPDLRLY
jgi:menaquinone-dependent protoporphyrinogen oxidase